MTDLASTSAACTGAAVNAVRSTRPVATRLFCMTFLPQSPRANGNIQPARPGGQSHLTGYDETPRTRDIDWGNRKACRGGHAAAKRLSGASARSALSYFLLKRFVIWFGAPPPLAGE